MSNWLLAGALLAGYVAGAIPGSNIVARIFKGVDLRRIGSGTVSPSNLYHAAGLWPAVIAGAFEVAKGSVGPLLAGSGQPLVAGLAGALAVAGHNWSPFLKGSGGRGLSTATGALFIVAWPAAVLMCAGLAVGALIRKIFTAMSVALVALVPALIIIGGLREAAAAAIVVAPIGIKTGMLIYRRWAAKRRAAQES